MGAKYQLSGFGYVSQAKSVVPYFNRCSFRQYKTNFLLPYSQKEKRENDGKVPATPSTIQTDKLSSSEKQIMILVSAAG